MSNILLPKPALGTPIAKGQLLAKGLVANFPFSDGRGDILSDFSLEKNHGTITGPTWAGNALDFDDTEYVDCGGNDLLNLTDGITVNVSFRMQSFLQSDNMIFSKGNNSIGYYMEVQPTGVLIWRFDNARGGTGSDAVVVPNVISLNTWYFVSVTYSKDLQLMAVYIDGKFVQSETATGEALNASTISFKLGAWYDLSDFFSDCIMDYVSIYNRALSASEIAALYINPNLPMQQPPIWLFTPPVVVGAVPKGPLGHPLHGPFAGPIAC